MSLRLLLGDPILLLVQTYHSSASCNNYIIFFLLPTTYSVLHPFFRYVYLFILLSFSGHLSFSFASSTAPQLISTFVVHFVNGFRSNLPLFIDLDFHSSSTSPSTRSILTIFYIWICPFLLRSAHVTVKLCVCFKLRTLSTILSFFLRNRMLHWFSTYLKERRQVVKISDIITDRMQIGNGIPQSSSLGPLLFLVYVNDLENCFSSKLLSVNHCLRRLRNSEVFSNKEMKRKGLYICNISYVEENKKYIQYKVHS